jgi:hypothetical protein
MLSGILIRAVPVVTTFRCGTTPLPFDLYFTFGLSQLSHPYRGSSSSVFFVFMFRFLFVGS